MNKSPLYNGKTITPIKLFLLSLVSKNITVELAENGDSKAYQVISRVVVKPVFFQERKAILYKAGVPISAKTYDQLQHKIKSILIGVPVSFNTLIDEKLSPLGDVIGYLDTSDNTLRINTNKP